MIDDLAKAYLLDDLRDARKALVTNLDGLSEYDARRPLTPSGTNLLGVVKHVALWEGHYFGTVFGRPVSHRLAAWDDDQGTKEHLWAREDETRQQIIELYRSVCAQSDETIDALPLDAPGFVPWWPRPHVTLFAAMVHVLNDTTWHGGQTHTALEQLETQPDAGGTADRLAHVQELERIARVMQTQPDRLSRPC